MNHLHDTHYHLDLSENPEWMVDEIEKQKIYTIAVTNSPSVFFHTKKLTEGKKYVRPALGLHPELAFSRQQELNLFLELASETKYIGEVGLDFNKKSGEDYDTQKKVFAKIVETCALLGSKVLTVHSRKAISDVLDIITPKFPGKVILHWYSSNQKDLQRAINYGCFISVNYPMTCSQSGIRIIRSIPLERILLESDGPFASALSKPCTPMTCHNTIAELSAILKDQLSAAQLIVKLSENFRTVIS